MIPIMAQLTGNKAITSHSQTELSTILTYWVTQGYLRHIDIAFAGWLQQECPDTPQELVLAAALTSYQAGRGSVCLALDALREDPLRLLGWSLPGSSPSFEIHATRAWLARLANSAPQQLQHAQVLCEAGDDITHTTPLLRDGDNIYLRRYWKYEKIVETAINQRLNAQDEPLVAATTLRPLLQHLFNDDPHDIPNRQRLACALATRRSFMIMTGGPGTGKTTTVVKVLVLLQALASQNANTDKNSTLHIQLAAPTGKAAARLHHSIAQAIDYLPWDTLSNTSSLRDSIPTQVHTLHRILGVNPQRHQIRRNKDNPIVADVLVIDEASMVDLELMAATVSALPPHCRLILLGDQNQLPSIGSGAVLRQLCRRGGQLRFQQETANWLTQATGEALPLSTIDPDATMLDQSIIELRHSRRFKTDSAIAALANAVLHGNTVHSVIHNSSTTEELQWLTPANPAESTFKNLILFGHHGSTSRAHNTGYGYVYYLNVMRQARPHNPSPADQTHWAAQVLQAFEKFQVLCAVHQGDWGTEALNIRIAQWLHDTGALSSINNWYPGRPVIVTRNDYSLGLSNGDIGITLPYHDQNGEHLRVAFPANNSSNHIRWFSPSRLNATETVFSLTIHKSQGSEFDHTVIILPDQPSPILSRELLYTALTRAKTSLSLVSPSGEQMLSKVIRQPTLRSGGTFQQLFMGKS